MREAQYHAEAIENFAAEHASDVGRTTSRIVAGCGARDWLRDRIGPDLHRGDPEPESLRLASNRQSKDWTRRFAARQKSLALHPSTFESQCFEAARVHLEPRCHQGPVGPRKLDTHKRTLSTKRERHRRCAARGYVGIRIKEGNLSPVVVKFDDEL